MPLPTVNRAAASEPVKASPLVDSYVDFLRGTQGVSEATIVLRRQFVTPFVGHLERANTIDDLKELAPSLIHDYVIEASPKLQRASRKHLVSALRSFLRFLHIRRYVNRNLVDAVPIIATRKLDRLPQGIPWEDVQKLLAAPDLDTPCGRRNHAILLLLATYGVRIGQATHLHLNEIDWHQGVIQFRSEKGCRPLSFPLNAAVAEALLRYIRCDRGQLPFPEVFLTHRGETRPLSLNNHLGGAIKGYYRAAGIDVPRRGAAHPIRHAFATRLMQEGTPIKTIADLLGHRSIDNTFLYTKVDVGRLRSLAVEWPGVES
jgi:integrase/recombinase XerD